MDRIKITGLNSYEYEHGFDRKALQLLKNTRGLATVIQKISEYGIETFTRMQLVGSGLKISATHFEVLHELLIEACSILDIDELPEFYLMQGEMFSTTVGVDKPIIAISNGLVDKLNDKELLYVIGYQLSYIKSKSMLYQQVAHAINILALVGVGGPINIITGPIKMAIKWWSKMSHYSADRCGLLCCQDIDVVLSVFMKLAGQPEKMYSQVDVEEFKQQAYEFDEFDFNNYNKVVKFLIAMDETHPNHVIRAAELLKWVRSSDYENILNRKPVVNKDNKEKCSFCGSECLGDEIFCSNCGNRVVAKKVNCSACNHEIDEDDIFCMNCGKSLEDNS